MSKLGRDFGIAFVGCGFVGNYYQQTLVNHPHLKLRGVYDQDADRLQAFCRTYRTSAYQSLEHLLADDTVDIVVNLTVPRSHFEITHAALAHGKHVYSEKPLAWTFEESLQLQKLAEEKGVRLAVAPCSILGEACQAALKVVRSGKLGKIRLVYAELDDGLVTSMNFESWKTKSGPAWPFRDEFETGCALEHSAYAVYWLVAMFGSVVKVSTFADELIPEKFENYQLKTRAPDFSVGILKFESGVVARVTNSIVADRNHQLKIFGENLSLTVGHLWDYESPVWTRSWQTKPQRVPLSKTRPSIYPESGFRMDFARGVNELACAIEQNRESYLSSRIAIHVDEISHALSSSCVEKSINSRCEMMAIRD